MNEMTGVTTKVAMCGDKKLSHHEQAMAKPEIQIKVQKEKNLTLKDLIYMHIKSFYNVYIV